MSSLLASIARALSTHWKRGLLALVLGIVGLGVLIGSQSGSPEGDFTIPGTESQQALDLLQDRFPEAAGAQSQVVYTVPDGTIESPEAREAIGSSIEEIASLDHVSTVDDPFAKGGVVSPEGDTALVTVQYDVQQLDLEAADGEALEAAARTAEDGGVTVEARGELIELAAQQTFPVGELIGILIAIVLLTLLFRSGWATFVTLAGALTGVILSQMILAAVSEPLGIPEFATTLAVMLGLGAGIDYALLIFGRFREQLAAGDTPVEAAARAHATSGVSVVAAGLIVIVAISGLLAVGIPLVGKMGVGTGIAIAMVVFSSIVVLPIFAGALGKRLEPKDPAHVARSEGFERWGRRLVAHPWLAVGAGALVMIVLALPFTDLRLGQPDDGNKPAGTTDRRAYDQLADSFGAGFTGPLLLAVGSTDGGEVDPAQLGQVTAAIESDDGVAAVAKPAPNPDGTAAIINVIPTSSPQDERTSALVDRLRDQILPAATQDTSLDVFVGGQTANFEDFSNKIADRLPLFIGIVLVLSIVLLIAVFRSLWVPLASAVFNLLSIGAAYGVVVAVFQWGWGASLLGVESGVPIVSFVPLLMFAIVFGLSMDYNVFLLSRIREAYFEGDGPAESVVHGLSRIAKVVLVAGLIMTAVFLAFVSGNDVVIKMFGLGLGAAILIDVLIVRMVISPALMVLLGDKAWWLPGWLDRILPNVSLEGSHETRTERGPAPTAPEPSSA